MTPISLQNHQNLSQTFTKVEEKDRRSSDQNSIEILYGSDNALCNKARKMCVFIERFMLSDLEYASGGVSADTVAKAAQYLSDHNLNDVAVEVNSYAPAWYANRVFSNPKTSLCSKILLGPLTILLNTLGLNKVVLGDRYDVMSNSVYLSSNDPDIAVFYSGVAEYFNESKTPVLDSVLCPVKLLSRAPFATSSLLSTIHDSVIDWAKEKTTEKEALRTSKVIRSLGYMEYTTTLVGQIAIIGGFAANFLLFCK